MINQLLNDHKINETEVFNLLSSMSENGADYSDLFIQHSIAESWVLDEGIVKDGSYNSVFGKENTSMANEESMIVGKNNSLSNNVASYTLGSSNTSNTNTNSMVVGDTNTTTNNVYSFVNGKTN